MLINFSIGNFLSFKKIQELSMISGRVRNKEERLYKDNNIKLLKLLALYGANASGKSNLVEAFRFAKAYIINNKKLSLRDYFYKLDEDYKNKSSYFEFEIIIDNKYYSYGFEIILNTMKLNSEWLIELKNNSKDKLIYKIDYDNFKFECNISFQNSKNKTRFNIYIDDILNNQNSLFLTDLNLTKLKYITENKELHIIYKVFEWFIYFLNIDDFTIRPNPINPDFNYFKIYDKKKIMDLISSFGVGINDFYLENITWEEFINKITDSKLREFLNSFYNHFLYGRKKRKETIGLEYSNNLYIIEFEKDNKPKVTTLLFEHELKGKNHMFSITEESDGTRRLIELIRILFSKDKKVFVIDEIDRSLHPKLTYNFIKTYLELVKEKNIQLIITTHESRLLDLNLLRQDEIWITEKNNKGFSELFSLDDFNVRFDKKIDKAYLEGRYGGIPKLTPNFINKDKFNEKIL